MPLGWPRLSARAAFTLLWPAPPLAALLLTQRFSPAAWLVSLLTLITVWPASLAVSRAFGPRAGVGASVAGVILIAGWFALPEPVPLAQPAAVEQRFTHAGQAIRHSIQPPREGPEWQAAWVTEPIPDAYLWLFAISDPDSERRLSVMLNGTPLGTLGESTLVPAEGPLSPGGRQWHRVPIGRALIDASQTLEVIVRPEPDVSPDARIGIVGGYSLRPTAGPQSSAFFDGSSWSSSPHTLFDLSLPGNARVSPATLVGPFRYYVELRLIEPDSRRLRAAYY